MVIALIIPVEANLLFFFFFNVGSHTPKLNEIGK